ncbi:helix-turn-helix domain-containing protein [Lutimaribacter marinistellae]|uniref:Helix-turn-helix domain-containing protein n=1 Tax=Lutimaribacter marinistellae TaxID=1820329 RepID=A0ABV7TKT4_9RHOB
MQANIAYRCQVPHQENVDFRDVMTVLHPATAALQHPNEIGEFTSWDLDFRQISPGSGATHVSVNSGQLVSTLWLRMGSRVHQVGSAPRDTLTFGFPEPRGLSSWRRRPAPRLPLVCFGAGHEFDGVSESGFAAFTISIGQAAFDRIAGDFGFEPSPEARQPTVLDLESRPRAALHLRRKLTDFSSEMACGPQTELEEELALALLLATLQADGARDEGTSRMRDRVLQRALEIMDARADTPPGIRELCVLCDSSLPTLQRAFIERFGMGPKAYQVHLRLNRVRQDLLSGRHGNRVADAANRWGFWHMGQFAKDYRKIFNCLPSEDLNRKI